MFISNSFSLNMLSDTGRFTQLNVEPIGLDEARTYARTANSAVGHKDTARIFSGLLDREVEPSRVTISLREGDQLLVGQYRGPRLPEGATELPQGATIEWLLVNVY